MPPDQQTKVSFFLVDQHSSMCLVSAVEPLRSANRIMGEDYYSWEFLSHDGEPVTASNGMEISVAGAISEHTETDYLFVCASLDHDPPYRQKLHACLRQLDRRGVKLGAVSNATFILARAGLLKDTRCTVHWEYAPAFQEAFPEIEYVPSLYVIDNNRFTGSGGVSSMELMLRIIERDHGQDICLEVANQFHLDRIRNEESQQRSGSIARLDNLPAALQGAVRLMLENIETPLSNAEIAAFLGTSVRNLERLFKRDLKTSPAKFYLSLRLEKARELLLHTNLSTLEIALQSGFSSSSYFARCFHRQHGKKPSETRN